MIFLVFVSNNGLGIQLLSNNFVPVGCGLGEQKVPRCCSWLSRVRGELCEVEG